MPFSMTGYGAAEGPVGGGQLRVEIRTVNHRFYNPAFKLSSDLASLEGELRERLRRDFERGHVAVSVRWLTPPTSRAGVLQLDVERAREAMARLRELQMAVGLSGEISLDLLARQVDVLTTGEPDAEPVHWAEFEPIVADAAADCRAMRRREGEALAGELRSRLDELEGLAGRVEARAPERLVKERERLAAAVAALLDGRQADDARLAQEIAFTAERLDITEELVRLKSHLNQFREMLDRPEPMGRKMEFLLQEFNREANTIGSKANDAGISYLTVEIKSELEKMREQVQNVE